MGWVHFWPWQFYKRLGVLLWHSRVSDGQDIRLPRDRDRTATTAKISATATNAPIHMFIYHSSSPGILRS